MIKTETVVGVFDTDIGLTSVATPGGIGQTSVVTFDPNTNTIKNGAAAVAAAGGGGGSVTLVSSNTTLSSAHDGQILRCSSGVTLTYPTGLGGSFSCIVDCPVSGAVSVAASGSTVNGSATTLTRTRANNPAGFVIRALAADVAGVSGA